MRGKLSRGQTSMGEKVAVHEYLSDVVRTPTMRSTRISVDCLPVMKSRLSPSLELNLIQKTGAGGTSAMM